MTLLHFDASPTITLRVTRLEAFRRTQISSPSRRAFGLAYETQTEKPSSDGFVAKPNKPRIHGQTSPLQASSTPSLSPLVPGWSPRSCLVL
jgi:hypothetical protein